jgi:3-oxoacyl-[acyl-carrier-protein] synthase II
MDLVPLKPRKHDVNVAMSNSFGFGGTNAALIFAKA